MALAYPGQGDCMIYHIPVKMKPLYDPGANLVLDGIPSESFWEKSNNLNGTAIIPLSAEMIGNNTPRVVNLSLSFVMNDEYLYVLGEWEDNSTRPNLGLSNYDGLFFCWDIDVVNFSANFWNGMVTDEMGGGNVDAWGWICTSFPPATPDNGSSYYCDDASFGDTGWNPGFELQDVEIGYTYRENVSYTVELKRKLITLDEMDVQFSESKIYKFNMGIMDDGTHEDHLVSWTIELDLREDPELPMIPGFILPHVIIICSIFILAIIFNTKKIRVISKINE